ncbi:TPA: hypothetical protein DCZ17_03850 [Candidatus Collierbacteria bacterium]|nr:hypothetical protein [Candidatus Collierbacteria bacterium]
MITPDRKPSDNLPPSEPPSKIDIYRGIEFVSNIFGIKPIDLGIEPKADIFTALALMTSIDKKTHGREGNFNLSHLQAAHLATRLALHTTGLTNTEDRMTALITGATGPEITQFFEKIFPQNLPNNKRIQNSVMRAQNKNTRQSMLAILRSEQITEQRFSQLLDRQQAILFDSQATNALLYLMNNHIPLAKIVTDAANITLPSLQPGIAAQLDTLSFFSPEDLKTYQQITDLYRFGTRQAVKLAEQKLQAEILQRNLIEIMGNSGRVVIGGVIGGFLNLLGGTANSIIEGGTAGFEQLQNGWKKRSSSHSPSRSNLSYPPSPPPRPTPPPTLPPPKPNK